MTFTIQSSHRISTKLNRVLEVLFGCEDIIIITIHNADQQMFQSVGSPQNDSVNSYLWYTLFSHTRHSAMSQHEQRCSSDIKPAVHWSPHASSAHVSFEFRFLSKATGPSWWATYWPYVPTSISTRMAITKNLARFQSNLSQEPSSIIKHDIACRNTRKGHWLLL